MEKITWHVGDVVRKLRDTRGLTQDELRTMARIDRGTIVAVEAGENMTRETLRKIADAFGMSLASLEAAVPITPSAELRLVVEHDDRLKPAHRVAFRTALLAAVAQAVKNAD